MAACGRGPGVVLQKRVHDDGLATAAFPVEPAGLGHQLGQLAVRGDETVAGRAGDGRPRSVGRTAERLAITFQPLGEIGQIHLFGGAQ